MSRFSQTIARMHTRERIAVLLCGVAVLSFMLYLGVYRPVTVAISAAEQRMAGAEALLVEMATGVARVSALDGASANPSDSQLRPALRTRVSRAANGAGLLLSRVQPGDGGRLNVWLDEANAAEVMRWVETLASKHGVVAERVSLNRVQDTDLSAGVVSAVILFADSAGGGR